MTKATQRVRAVERLRDNRKTIKVMRGRVEWFIENGYGELDNIKEGLFILAELLDQLERVNEALKELI
ncbi:MAG: hypothetical protein DDT19_01772 [Syntrophomonadaceae bacterium]|nr:hypothetical protein [Bacillota bacterium]